jgi:DNA-binding NarL/FixJ family response regulator
MRVSILIADDYGIVRRGLRALLSNQADWRIVGEAANGREAVAQAAKLRPDIVLLDVLMPQLNGLDAARLILKAVPETRVLILSDSHTDEMIEKAFRAGVRGYVLKSDAEADLVTAINALMNGRTFFTSAASERLLERLRREPIDDGPPLLTTRETEIIQLLAEGKSNKEVANILGISSRTVENHRAQIMQRLGLRSFSDLVRWAIRNAIIEP